MTERRTLRGGAPNAGGYRQLVAGPGEPHVVRDELCAPRPPDDELLTIAHLSDIHICDAQSPARAEALGRLADPDSPVHELLTELGAYRAQEMLTAQVADAMVRAVNAVPRGPVGGRATDLAIATGDNIDSAQANELDWYLGLLEGATVRADSGDLSRWEGVADSANDDERYWHPDGHCRDLPRERFGFPTVPGLLDAVRAPFEAAGLDVPWLAVHGNHDRLLQGLLPAVSERAQATLGAEKPVALPPGLSAEQALEMLAGLAALDPAALALMERAPRRLVTADPRRRVVSAEDFVAAHDRPGARPPRHGFPADGGSYYRHDVGPVTLLVLDTVNTHGGWQGSLDRVQFAWLGAELELADAERRYVVLAGHHPLSTLVNDGGPDARVLGPELEAELAAHPSLVLWLDGHTHQSAVTPHGTWWEVTAPSLVDWPQQARIVELLRGDGVLTIAATMLDHVGQAPWQGGIAGVAELAGLSRELAANDWQGRGWPFDAQPLAGHAADRNVLLTLPDPWA